MELKCKIYNLDIPDKNGVVYTRAAINNAYEKYLGSKIPVYIRDGTEEDGIIVGAATIIDVNYPEIDFYVSTNNEIIKQCVDAKVGGFVMRGFGEIDTLEKIKLVHNYKLTELNYYLSPAQSTSFEIINNDILSVDLTEGEDFTNDLSKIY
jgi:hypothetical protein